MAPREAARALPMALSLAAVAAGAWARRPPSELWPGQGCATLGRCCPGRDPTCAARGPPRCFCDQACGAARDCCADYARVCPVVSCMVAECGGWSRCAKPCQVSYHVHRRHVLQEPRNGGVPCPPLEERAGCMEYWSHQGVECQQSLQGETKAQGGYETCLRHMTVPALIIPSSYRKEWKKQGVPKEQETVGNQLLLWRAASHPGAEGPGRGSGSFQTVPAPWSTASSSSSSHGPATAQTSLSKVAWMAEKPLRRLGILQDEGVGTSLQF